ncbi:MAG TPA: YoaK family protein [Burkholderiaceae bacterium]|nr:YoaK family protein [Burkholderiaceae bacterium]
MLLLTREWTAGDRTPNTNLRLGQVLAFVAGAANAGGFLAVGQYTSHMTGIVSGMADNLVLGRIALVLSGGLALSCFLVGAMLTAILVNWGQQRNFHSCYALPLVVEALLMLLFGLVGANLGLQTALLVPTTVLLLCFMMGLQNAIITKASRSEVRTTHVTGMVTDLGIELGKLVYLNRRRAAAPNAPGVHANRARLRTHGSLVGLFLIGGVLGAAGFQQMGYSTTIPLALLLLLLSAGPLWRDLKQHRTVAHG